MKEPESQDPMAEATTIRDAPTRDHLRADEIGPAFDGLSRDDKLKLYAVEAHLLGGTGLGKGDLLREAVCRALDGERKCPRDIAFMAFLVMTMKSIAFHARIKRRRTVVAGDPSDPAHADPLDPPFTPSPEDGAIAASVLRALYAHFENDEEATLVLMGWAEDLHGKELREATDLDQTRLDYAIKRIRTGARKLYPDGWKT
jgi:DNA-directed RNA polymerase specialized sigma24 family protein